MYHRRAAADLPNPSFQGNCSNVTIVILMYQTPDGFSTVQVLEALEALYSGNVTVTQYYTSLICSASTDVIFPTDAPTPSPTQLPTAPTPAPTEGNCPPFQIKTLCRRNKVHKGKKIKYTIVMAQDIKSMIDSVDKKKLKSTLKTTTMKDLKVALTYDNVYVRVNIPAGLHYSSAAAFPRIRGHKKPIVESTMLVWGPFLVKPLKARHFSFNFKIDSSLTSGTDLIISAYIYILNSNGREVCITDIPNADVSWAR